ncbi:S8 family peptidase [Microbacterium foliorum]
MTRVRRSIAAVIGVVALSIVVAVPAAAATDASEGGLWYFTRGKVQAAIDAGFDGAGVTIAVVDTQVNPDAPGLRGADLEVREESYCFDASGERYDAVSSDYIAANHGTNVTSMILGTGEAVGGTPIRGVAPGAKVLYYNSMVTSSAPQGNDVDSTCLQENGELIGDGDTREERNLASGLAQAISDAVDDGADIISVSLGGLVDASYAVAKAHAAGVVVLGSLPNVGGVGDWPSSYNGVIAVQAFGPDGQIQYSTYDPALAEPSPNLSDDVIIASPGLDVIAQGTADSWDAQQLRSGTSFAAPIAAGFLAVVKQKYPDATSNQLIQSLIHNTGTKGEHEPKWDNSGGYGAISLTGMLAVDPTKYPDVNPLFDAENEDALPNQATVDEEARLLEAEATSQPTSDPAGGASSEGVDAMPFLVGGGVVIAILVIGGVVLAVVLTRSSRRQTTQQGGDHRE